MIQNVCLGDIHSDGGEKEEKSEGNRDEYASEDNSDSERLVQFRRKDIVNKDIDKCSTDKNSERINSFVSNSLTQQYFILLISVP